MRRHIAAWMLLAVFLPMLLMESFHVHEAEATTTTECADCVQHSCHGHLAPTASYTHDCVLCQVHSFTFVAVSTVSLVLPTEVASARIDDRQLRVCVAQSGIVGLRAPPAFSI